MKEQKAFMPWMRGLLLVAGFYNLIWGLFIFNLPDSFHRWLVQVEAPTPHWVEIQGIGILIFGVLYFMAGLYPIRLWFIPWLGVFSKLIGLILAFIMLNGSLHLPSGEINRHLLFHLIMNDLVWIPPFIMIGMRAYHVHRLIR